MTKVISISDDAYGELTKLKGDASFSKIILKLAKIKRGESLMNFAGMWKGKEWDKIAEDLKKERKVSSRRIR